MLTLRKLEIDDWEQIVRNLSELGVTRKLLIESLSLGVRKYHARSDGLPPCHAGAIPSAEALASLARGLGAVGAEAGHNKRRTWIHDGWRIKSVCNEGVGAFSLAVWAGDDDTGLKNLGPGRPRPRGTKGGETLQEVLASRSQLDIFGVLSKEQRELVLTQHGPTSSDKRIFGVLLYRIELDDNRCRIYAEVSFPDAYDEEKKRVTEWAHREILSPIDLDLSTSPEHTFADADGDDSEPYYGRD